MNANVLALRAVAELSPRHSIEPVFGCIMITMLLARPPRKIN